MSLCQSQELVGRARQRITQSGLELRLISETDLTSNLSTPLKGSPEDVTPTTNQKPFKRRMTLLPSIEEKKSSL